MAPSQDRGSTKMLRELFGREIPERPEEVAKALGISLEKVKLLRWWVKGQPAPDWIFASFLVQPAMIGEVAGSLIKSGLVVQGFPIGLPAFDSAIINVTNAPQEVMG